MLQNIHKRWVMIALIVSETLGGGGEEEVVDKLSKDYLQSEILISTRLNHLSSHNLLKKMDVICSMEYAYL